MGDVTCLTQSGVKAPPGVRGPPMDVSRPSVAPSQLGTKQITFLINMYTRPAQSSLHVALKNFRNKPIAEHGRSKLYASSLQTRLQNRREVSRYVPKYPRDRGNKGRLTKKQSSIA